MSATAPPKPQEDLQSVESHQDLQSVEIHNVLSNERRQMTLQLLSEEEGDEEISVRELSERIAERESGESPPPRNIRQSVYVSLHQTHLPTLDKLDIVEYDSAAKTVHPETNADQVLQAMKPDSQPTFDSYYLIISLVGLLVIVASLAGVPALDPMVAGALSGILFSVSAGLATYRTVMNSDRLA